MGITPYSFTDVFLQQSCAPSHEQPKSDFSALLPPTYMPPESAFVMDATFAYVTMGVMVVTMAFGNMIILNYVSGDYPFFHSNVVL